MHKKELEIETEVLHMRTEITQTANKIHALKGETNRLIKELDLNITD